MPRRAYRRDRFGKRVLRLIWLAALCPLTTCAGAQDDSSASRRIGAGATSAATAPSRTTPGPPTTPPLVAAARRQIGVTLHYDPAYVVLAYPNGDVAQNRGVCTDVVIRALRTQGLDLQQRVHEDMRANFALYPRKWGLRGPDRNIDHRRVPNLQTWFERQGWDLAASDRAADYRAGDLVTWMLPGNLPHIGIVSERKSRSGAPLIIHNIGRGAREENILFDYPITGRYRPRLP
ncbi:MAG: DUF1287 domain-containing protein [Lysobacteraceae bacterium]|nr:MAG: DUF1287 domain-containing protein [Xanthomonadaceae bacterium]